MDPKELVPAAVREAQERKAGQLGLLHHIRAAKQQPATHAHAQAAR